jgi:copper chaperone NosL
MKPARISLLSKLLLVIAAALLVISIFVPIWRIELDAPQYPEGLRLQIFANRLGGDVDVINGLNHYIGMKTLHAGDFIEFTILPYLIGFIALFFIIAAIRGTKRWLYAAFILLVIFGAVAMVDFWLWEYNYGHHLDPNAAIIVPGMAYQPPLIGFKQLLNFGAFSIPDTGGWLFVVAGLLLLSATCKEAGLFRRFEKKRLSAFMTVCSVLILLTGCSNQEQEPIVLHTDMCDNCRMTIADGRFAAEIMTKKGRVYKFDDMHCMQAFTKEKTNGEVSRYWINDFAADNILTDATKAWYVQHESLRSPMGGNTAAFPDKAAAEKLAADYGVLISNWDQLAKQ